MQEGLLSLRESDDDESTFLESDDDESTFLESDDDEALGEARRWRRLRAPRNYGQGVRGTAGGRIAVPGGGTAQVQFNRRLVSEAEFKKALSLVRADMQRDRTSIAELDGKVTKGLKNLRERSEQGAMLPLIMSMMQPKPSIAEIKFSDTQPSGSESFKGKAATVSSVTLGEQKDLTPLLMVMMMGGMGTSDTSSGGFGGMQQFMMLFAITQMAK